LSCCCVCDLLIFSLGIEEDNYERSLQNANVMKRALPCGILYLTRAPLWYSFARNRGGQLRAQPAERKCDEARPPLRYYIPNRGSLAFNKILFRFKAVMWESIILVSRPPPTCKACPLAIRLHDRSAMYTLPPPWVCHTRYYIGDGNIV